MGHVFEGRGFLSNPKKNKKNEFQRDGGSTGEKPKPDVRSS